MFSEAMEDSPYPIIPISCKKKQNFNMLHKELENKINSYLGRQVRKINVSLEDYNKTYAWIKE
jgi:translation initiation factor 2 gamma subunit (eIF-2gamma)